MSETPLGLRPLRIAYSRESEADLLARSDVLAAIGFGGARASEDPRSLVVGLEPVGDAVHEVWIADGAVRSGRDGIVRWSSDGDYGFVSVEVDEAAYGGIAGAAEHAYRELIAFAQSSVTPHVLRLWNYLDAINVGDGDDERYRRFCVGRARSLDALLGRYPAATAIGRRDGARRLQVYALTARVGGTPVENPRQVSAWRYPREYGPTPPSFARGMVAPSGQLLISGTAAVVGSDSRHRDDTAAQLDETLTNLGSLLAASRGPSTHLGAGSLLKAYLRRGEDAVLAERKLRERVPGLDGLLLLAGDICRRELLIEIDGLHT